MAFGYHTYGLRRPRIPSIIGSRESEVGNRMRSGFPALASADGYGSLGLLVLFWLLITERACSSGG